MDVRILYGNCYGGYSLHDSNRKVNGKDYAARIPLLVNLIVGSGAAVFFAVEMHEEEDSSFGSAKNGAAYFLARLKETDADWALAYGKSGNQCFYRPSVVSSVTAKNKQMPGGRDMTDFTIVDSATSYQWHGLHAHFRADDHDPDKSRDKERRQQGKFLADYSAQFQRALITGDFNSSTEGAGRPRALFKAAGFDGLRERGAVVNGTRSTRSKSSSAHFWIEDIFTRKAQKVSNSQLILTGDASDHNGWLVTTVTWADAGVPALQTDLRPVQSSRIAAYAGLPWEARARFPNLTVGPPVRFTKATLVENYCAPSTLTLQGRTSDLDNATVFGQGIVLTDDQGAIRCSGPLTDAERTGKKQMTLTFRSDTIETAGRIIWPNPTGEWSKSGQPNVAHILSGPAETRLLGYLNAHLGAGARTERRLTTMRQPATAGRGPSAVSSGRFDILGELLATLAEAAGLHFGMRQAYDAATPFLEFYLQAAPDLSAWARFGTPEAGGPYMLSDAWSYKASRPAGNVILGAAGGEGADRILTALSDASSISLFGRVESFLDQRGSTDTTEIAAGLAKALLDKAGRSEVNVPLGAVPGIGTTIPIGAMVSASLDGNVVTERIRQITTVLSSEDNQAPTQVGAVFGSPDASVASPTWRQLNDMLSRLRELEHR